MLASVWRTAEALTSQYSSTAQDILRGKPTEIDMLNGYIARRADELGVGARQSCACMHWSSCAKRATTLSRIGPPFRGVFANLLTAFTPDGNAFNPSAQRDYVEWVLARKVHGVSVQLSSGEFGFMTGDERATVIDSVARTVDQRVPVLAGVSELSLRDTCELARRAEGSGVSAVMVMPAPTSC